MIQVMDTTCPLCRRVFVMRRHADCINQPCTPCWGTLPASARAPYLHALRQLPPAQRQGFAHRDPVLHAPPTLAAYVAYLEERAQCPR